MNLDATCGALINMTDAGNQVLTDPSVGPYDGTDDTLIGVANNSSSTVASLALSSNTQIFAFDGDGLCFYAVTGCPFGTTTYEGINTKFAGINSALTGGTVSFTGGLAPGATAYFSLEQTLSGNVVTSGGPTSGEQAGPPNGSESQTTCSNGSPVNCGSGEFWHTFDDLTVPGRGVSLDFNRTYTSGRAGSGGPLGFGWTNSYAMSLSKDASGNATITQENGATVTFLPSGGGYIAAPRVLATLTANADGSYTFTRFVGGVRYTFSSGGQLVSEMDRNGYATTLAYTGGQLTSVTDPAGRALTFGYTGANLTKVTDPIGRTVQFTYDASGNLATATDPNTGMWSFTYDANHLLLTMTDPRSGTTSNTYNGSAQVTKQVDPMQRTSSWAYSGNPVNSAGGTTTITDPLNNVITFQYQNLELMSKTEGVGTSVAATTSYSYDPATLGVTSVTDPNNHTTTYTYDALGNKVSQTEPLTNRTYSYTYNSLNEPLTVTDPLTITASYTYDSHGNLTSTSRPLTSTSQAAVTTLTYGDSTHPGDVTAMTDPDSKTSIYAYDTAGDLTRSTDPLGDVTTNAYDAIGRRTMMVSPNGNVSGGNPAAFTSTYTFDALSNLLSTKDALGHGASSTYDKNSNVATATDADGNVTTYTYDADNELTKTTRADTTTVQTGYDADGNATSQTDATNHVTSYAYDALNRETSSTDALLRTTSFGYDLAGNQTTVKDPSGRTTTSTYDAANELTAVAYSDGMTPGVTYAYTLDGQRSSMVDGTGTTTYIYDSLNRLSSSTDGAGQAVGYGYDLKGQLTQLTYPNGQPVIRGYDAAGRLTSVSDWNSHTTSFSYDADGNETSSVYPNTTTAALSYNAADQLMQISDAPTAAPNSAFASFAYTRDPIAQLASTTPTGVGQGNETYAYTKLNQLKSVNSGTYTYNPADTIAKLTSGATLGYDAANEVTSLSSPATTFGYDAQGSRMSSATGGGTTAYTYDQANRLTQVSIPPQSVQGLLSGGRDHSLGVQSDGSVWAWGENTDGELGNGTTLSVTTPVRVSGLSNGRAVAAGIAFSMALRSDGTVVTWGHDGYGLGSGSTTHSTTPLQVSGISTARGIAAGNYHMLSVLGDGTVRAWGYNAGGELGNGTTTNSSTPVTVSAASSIVQVAAGGLPGEAGHSLALRSDGTVRAWGYNNAGQLGIGTTTNATTPVQVIGLSNVIAIAAGGENSYALRSDGTVWAWGNNTYGQLGNTTAGSLATTPVQVSISGVTAIAAGGTHALALRSDGTLSAWGDNDDGELGDGGTCGSTCATPVQVHNLTGVATIGGGYKHSLAATPSGTAWAFGDNGAGQLGNGTTANATTPMPVSGLNATTPVPSITNYAYDGDGLRAAKTTTSATQHFAWDHSPSLPRLLTDGTTSWIYGPGGLPLEQVSGTTTLYYYQDQLGSTRVLADATGTVQGTYAYDAYGTVTAATGTVRNPLLFGGQYRDLETGFYYLRARYFDPTTAQFLSRDPANAVTRQPYSYGVGDPLNVVDPRGLGASVSDLMSCMTCQELSNEINKWTDVVEQKASNIVNNPLGLPLSGSSMTVQSHVASWLGYQNHLDKLITAWVLKGCGGSEDLPLRVLVWATEPVPQPNPQQQTAPSSTSPVSTTSAIAGALAIFGTVLWWAAKPGCLFTGPLAVPCAVAA